MYGRMDFSLDRQIAYDHAAELEKHSDKSYVEVLEEDTETFREVVK